MTTQRPNILFIVLDTLRRDHLSAYGYQRDTSPYLDEFTQRATLFERAIAPAQWTIPAHGSLFTGLYPSTHQLTQAYQQLSGSYPTLAEILQLEAYHTVAFCNNPMLGVLDNGLQRGFDHFYNYAGAAPNRPVDMNRSGIRRTVATAFRQFARRVTNQFAHSDTLFRMSLNPFLVPIWSRAVNYKGNTERSIDDLIDYWGRHHDGGADQPLFAFLNLMGAHMPYRPPQDYLDHIAPDIRRDQQAYRYMARHNADATAWISPADEPIEDWQQRALTGFYDAEIAHQDYHVGRLLNYMQKSGTLDNTMVIIVADHGDGHGDHNFFGHSFVVYQELVHVPLVIYYPDHFPADKRITTNVSTRRVFHTILDLLDVKPPIDETSPNGNIGGLSLTRSLNGKPDTERGIAFAEAFPPDNLLTILADRKPEMVNRMKLTQTRRGVYDGSHKLALVGEQIEGLYDVEHDPSETVNVAENNPNTADDLRQKVAHFVDAVTGQRADALQNGVSEDVVDNLRALGYME